MFPLKNLVLEERHATVASPCKLDPDSHPRPAARSLVAALACVDTYEAALTTCDRSDFPELNARAKGPEISSRSTGSGSGAI